MKTCFASRIGESQRAAMNQQNGGLMYKSMSERNLAEWIASQLIPAKVAFDLVEARIQQMSPLVDSAVQRDRLVSAWDEGREHISSFLDRVEQYLSSCRLNGSVMPISAMFLEEGIMAHKKAESVLRIVIASGKAHLVWIDNTKNSDKIRLSGDIASLYSYLSMLTANVCRGTED